jgi:hypothetical protein
MVVDLPGRRVGRTAIASRYSTMVGPEMLSPGARCAEL